MAQTNTAARDFWNEQMSKHQGVHFFLTVVASLFCYLFTGIRYVITGRVIVDLAKQGIIVGGRIATSILFFIALWVAARSTEPETMAHVLTMLPLVKITASQVDHFSVIAFTLLPDCLLLGCALLTIDQWVLAFKRGGQYWVWMIAYTIFAGLFTFIAIYTFTSFLHKGGAVIIQAGQVDGMTLVRAISGWFYALTEMIHAGVMAKYGKGHTTDTHQSQQPTPQGDISTIIKKAVEEATSDQAKTLGELKTQIEEVKNATQNTLPAVSQTPSKEEIIQEIMGGLSQQFEVFLNSRVNVSPVFETAQISASSSVSKQQSAGVLNSPKQPVSKQRKPGAKNSNTEIVRRSRKVSDQEVDDAVHPLLNKDHSLTHRKIAPLVNIPETTVYQSVKRWRAKQQAIVSGDIETPENDQAETAI